MADPGDLTLFERAVMDAALAGDHPVLNALREQLEVAKVRAREMTGVGLFVHLEVDRRVPAAQTSRESVQISDVGASIDGLEHDSGFVVFINHGYLDLLEAFSHDESWPDEIKGFEILYAQESNRKGRVKLFDYKPGAPRDLNALDL